MTENWIKGIPGKTWRPPSLRSDLAIRRMPFCSCLEEVSFDSWCWLWVLHVCTTSPTPAGPTYALKSCVSTCAAGWVRFRPIIGSMAEIWAGSCCVLVLSWLAQQSFCSPCCQNNAKQPWGFVNVSYQGHLFSHPCFLLSPHFCPGSCAATHVRLTAF